METDFVTADNEVIAGASQSPAVKLLMNQIEKQKDEIHQLRADNTEWSQNFDSRVEDYRKNQYYRPHSTYDKLVKQ